MKMQRITIRLSRRDLERLDAIRGRTDRSTYLRRLLRRAAPEIVPEPEDDGIAVSDEAFDRLRKMTAE
jgi:metal-responsive CopG/Arc/MetJ family transcriptional regulator